MRNSDISTQGNTTRASDHHATRMPGLLPAAVVSILAAGVTLAWLMTGATAEGNASAATSDLAPVAERDLEDALGTMAGSPAYLAQYRKGADGCAVPLAWVAVSSPGAASNAMVRIKSGGYFSPEFRISEVPVRVAIPYPAPYDSGHGTLTVMHGGSDLLLTLRPAWHIGGQGNMASHRVAWPVSKQCAAKNG